MLLTKLIFALSRTLIPDEILFLHLAKHILVLTIVPRDSSLISVEIK